MAFKQFNPLNVPESWERYWTKYPQGMTILESLFEWVSQVDEMVVNQNLLNTEVSFSSKQLNEFLEKFDKNLQKEVSDILKDWHDSGFLNIVINEALQNQMDELEKNTNERLDSGDLRIKQIRAPYNYTGPMVVFIDDDGKDTFMDIWKPVCDARGIKITLGIVTKWVGGTGRLTLSQLKNLQSEGYDIVSHSYSHDTTVFNSSAQDLATVPANLIEDEFLKSQNWMKENGLKGYETIVYPWGNFNTEQERRYKKLARQFFTQGVNASGNYNDTPNDNMYLNRKFVKHTNSMDDYKLDVDSAKTNNGLLIFGTHSISEEINSATLNELVTYIQTQNIPIMTLSEALKYKGNILSIGEIKDETKFYVGNTGDVLTDFGKSGFISLPYETTRKLDNPLSYYKLGTTETFIRNTEDYLTNTGGMITVYRAKNANGTPNDTFAYRSFKPLKTGIIFYSFWDWQEELWKEWVKPTTNGSIAFNEKWSKSTDRINGLKQEGDVVIGNISVKRQTLGGIVHDENIAKISGVQLPTNGSHFFTSTYFASGENPGVHAFAIQSDGLVKAQGNYLETNIDRLYLNFAYTVNN